MSLGIGVLKAAVALFLGACAMYVLTQSTENNEQESDFSNDPFRRKGTDSGGVLESLRKWKDNVNGTEETIPVDMTITWLKEKIKSYFEDVSVQKVAAIKVEKLVIENPDNSVYKDFYDEGYTDILAALDYSGNVKYFAAIKNTGVLDPEVSKLYGTERMVVVNR